MRQYNITGMSCAACSARIEKAVSKVPGVRSCSVSLLTNSMGVEGSATDEAVISAVQGAGYGASVKGGDTLKDRETPALRRRLIISLVFLAALMYISMGNAMWGWPLPPFFSGNHMATGLAQLLLCEIIMVINRKFFISGFKSIINRAPNMDALVALGSSAAFIYSTVSLFAMTGMQPDEHMHEFYFESAAMILTLITLGKMLEARSKGKTTDALKSLMKLAPETATVIRDGVEITVPAEQIVKGDIFVVRPGEHIPVDGVVTEGSSAVDESALTGESIPADKAEGSTVSAGTLNRSGFIRCEALKVGEDTTLSNIIRLVSDAAATKAPIAKVADKVSGIFVPAVMAIAVLTTLIWLIAGRTVGFALARGISVLVISCPCALGLATPVAIMVGSGVGARNGILFKTAASLEKTGRAQTVVLDKTGTVTEGRPQVTDILPAEGYTEEALLGIAYTLEKRSEHPLAGAVNMRAEERGIEAEDVTGFKALPGNGLTADAGGIRLCGGNESFIKSTAEIPEEMRLKADALSGEGKTPLYFSRGGELCGIIAVADVIKPDSREAVNELKNMGIRVVMLTGDNKRTADAIAAQAGADTVIAGVLPEGKERAIRELGREGTVVMVGDGINDAPALTAADIGIAIGAGTDVAIDAADVVLMKSRLSDVPAAIRLSRAALRNIHENLFWAFIYNTIGIPIAAGVFINLFGWQMNPMFGAAAMSLSSFCVVTNALRLNFVRIHDPGKDHRIKRKNNMKKKKGKEVVGMKRTLEIEGMMCGHCEARVKKALEALDGVKEAIVSHTDGTAVVTLEKEVGDDILRKAVEAQDYKVKAVR